MTDDERRWAARLRLQARILNNVGFEPETGCWPWLGRLNNQGYPTISQRVPGVDYPVTLFAHRVSLAVFHRAPEDGEEAAHDPVLCPLKHCCNYGHLYWATRSQNEIDKRHPKRLRIHKVPKPIGYEMLFV